VRIMKFTEAFGQKYWELPQKYSKLTQAERAEVRAQYTKLQNGMCIHCHAPLDREPAEKRGVDLSLFPRGMLLHPVHLHHCHKTDNTLGAVHALCNAVLWQYYGE